jgi:hypothetical protein
MVLLEPGQRRRSASPVTTDPPEYAFGERDEELLVRRPRCVHPRTSIAHPRIRVFDLCEHEIREAVEVLLESRLSMELAARDPLVLEPVEEPIREPGRRGSCSASRRWRCCLRAASISRGASRAGRRAPPLGRLLGLASRRLLDHDPPRLPV